MAASSYPPPSSLDSLLPEAVWKEPQPLVALLGEVDWDPNIHRRLSNVLHSVGLDQHVAGAVTVPICYQTLPKGYTFPPRKAYHPMKGGNGQPMDGYSVRGILKSHWPYKHARQIPSAVVFVSCAEMHWGLLEWGARETTITEELERLKGALSSRDVRIFTVLIRRGMGDDREWDERIMSLRRRANLDHRAMYVLSDPQDITAVAMNMRRLYKELRERTTTYYLGHGKRIKRWEGGLSPSTQMPLIARYRFKQAFNYEFLGNVEKVLKHYRRTFEALGEMMKLIGAHGGEGASSGPGLTPTTSHSNNGGYTVNSAMTLGGWSSQVKAVAEIVSFKICYYTMREAQHGEAVRQFRALMERFHWPSRSSSSSSSSSSGSLSRSLNSSMSASLTLSASEHYYNYSPPESRLDFLHYEWVCRQYELFGELLQRFPSPHLAGFGGSGQSSSESDYHCYADADLYISNAAMYMSKRRASAQSLVRTPRPSSSKYSVRLSSNFDVQGPLLRSPYFFGGRPRMTEPTLEDGLPDAEVANLIQAIMERDEAAFDHSSAVRRLLERSLAIYDPGRPVRHRFKAIQHLKLAEELAIAEMMGAAWEHYCLALQVLDEERAGCAQTTVSVLGRARLCALRLGKRLEYLDFSLKLLSNRLRAGLSPGHRRTYFLEALYLLTKSSDLEPVLRASLAEVPESVSILDPEFGKYASQVTGGALQASPSTTKDTAASSSFSPDSVREDDDVDNSSGPGPYEPMCSLTPDSIEVSLGCPWRQLLSFSVTFPSATASMGTLCLFTLRIVSHLPLPLHASSLHLRFNKDYAGTITIIDPSPLTPTQRLSESWSSSSSPPPPPPPPSAPDTTAKSPTHRRHLSLDDTKTVQAFLLLLPDHPLDLHLSLPIPGEAVEVGDVIHATQLKLSLALPPSSPDPSSPLLTRSRLSLSIPSGVKHMDGLGVIMHFAMEEDHDHTLVARPSTLPVPIRAPFRGFPSVGVVRPTARATVSLAPQQFGINKHHQSPQQRGGGGGGPIVSLVEHMQLLMLQVDTHEDRAEDPNLFVRCDPPPRSARPEDAFFFTMTPKGAYTHVALGKDLQPEAPLPVLPGGQQQQQGGGSIAPQSKVAVPIWFRPTREGRTRINVVLVYKSIKGGRPGPSSSSSHPQQQSSSSSSSGSSSNLSSLMISSDLIVDVESYPAFIATFDIASPGPWEVQPKPPGSGEGSIYSFFTGEEVVMRLGLRALTTTPGIVNGRVQIHQVVWHLEENLTSPMLVRSVSQPQLPKEGKILYDARESGGSEGSMQPSEVLSTCFHFLCPDKETAHPIRLGRIRIHWSLEEDEEEEGEGGGGAHSNYHPNQKWVACSEMECPFVTVLRPDVAVDLDVPLEAKFGEAFPLRWKILNTSNGVLSARLIIQDPSGPSENALLWGGKRESVVQLLPHRSVTLPVMLVPLATGPLALPRLGIYPSPDPASSFDPSATFFRISYRFADNLAVQSTGGGKQPSVGPEGRQAASNESRHVYVMPAAATVPAAPSSS